MPFETKLALIKIAENEFNSNMYTDEFEVMCSEALKLSGLSRTDLLDTAVAWFKGSAGASDFMAAKGAMLVYQMTE